VEEKLKDLEEQERKKNAEWMRLSAEYIQLRDRLADMPAGKEERLSELERKKSDLEEKTTSMQVRKGVLLQRIEDTKKIREEISQLKSDITHDADASAKYEVLKQAFSQDGVPHQIVRNIIPHITDTANNILGQMTGGTMGVEFVMERTVKGKDGDKATLDVLIDEYGKTTLPYASKSGGEKVKASLAVILALSEIKATAAGIQLGMLFIDEPPFLDDDGAQAYVDSLETIRHRYPDVKIMAITHDDAMKARFSQIITVIKTDDGSKVIY
jgi:exonuclease SbcC